MNITSEQVALFQQQGYLITDDLLNADQVLQIVERCGRLFKTQFETGIYPDEWYGRPGMSQPNASRQMTGLWRCDRALAGFTLSSAIAQINATLMSWQSARYGLDTFWAKPPSAPETYFHRNNTYARAIDPSSLITCWIALSDATAEAGTLEIVPNSHQWNCTDKIRFLHAPKEDYRTPLWKAADEAGAPATDILSIELPPGSAVFLHGDLWHGSGRNASETQIRRSLSISALSGQAKFQPPGVGAGYIFDRYRRMGDLELHESFYPILWNESGYRTPFLSDYCQDVLIS